MKHSIFNIRMSLVFSILLAVSTLSACGDFLNSSKNLDPKTPDGESRGPKRPDVNPFPPGFEDPNAGKFSEEKMLVNIGVNLLAPFAADLERQTLVLEEQLIRACAKAQMPKDLEVASWQEARRQWKVAMLAFHRADSAPVGPLSIDDRILSNRLYAWPLFNPCGLDVETVKTKEGIGTPATELPTPVRGFAALEYLLFEEGGISRCNSRAHPQVVKWSNLTAEEKRLDRCRLALKIAADTRSLTRDLAKEWDPKGRNYSRRFIDGSDPSMPTVLSATNAVTDSLFQIEALKDIRLARPLGLIKDCAASAGVCPEDAEHLYSGLALAAAHARTEALQDVFLGRFTDSARGQQINGFGFDDLLSNRGHQEVSSRLSAALEKAVSGLRSVKKESLTDLIGRMSKLECKESTPSERKVEICAIYQDIRSVTTILKSEFLAVLALRAPPVYQGDND